MTFSAEERDRILSEAHRHVADRDESQRDLTERLMRMPVEDPLQKWQREATEAKRKRQVERAEIRRKWAADRERERRAMTPPAGPDAGTIEWMIRNAILSERSFMTEVIGQSIGVELDKDVSALRKEMADRDKVIKAEREAHRREIGALHRELNAVRQSHADDLGRLVRDIKAVARTVDQLGTAISGKKMDELREDFANGFARLRADLKAMN